MVESQPSKLLVAGSIPVSRSNLRPPERVDDDTMHAAVDFGWQAAERSMADLSAEALKGRRPILPAEALKARRPM